MLKKEGGGVIDHSTQKQSDTQANTPAEVVASLADSQAEKTEGHTDQRKHERFHWKGKLSLKLDENTGVDFEFRSIDVEASDLSASGFAFIHRQYIYTGTRVYTRFTALPHQPVLEGLVQNCILIGGGKYRVGVHFAEPCERRRNH